MKRAILSLACAAILLFCLPMQAFTAIDFDGNVHHDWFDYPAQELSPDSECGITNATVRVAVLPKEGRVMFGFTAVAPGIAPDSPVGAAFLLDGQEIACWRHGAGGSSDDNDMYFNVEGKAYIPETAGNDYYTFEIRFRYGEAALAALENLYIKLYGPDPEAKPSRQLPCPIVTAEPVTTTKAPTTEKTTTTKAPAAEKVTTTKAPTTEKPTTTKAPTTEKPTTTTTTKEPTTEKPATTEKPTTTLPVYTTKQEIFSYTPQTATARATAAPKAAATAPAQTAQTTQPGTSRTEVFYYTVVYTDPPSPPSQPGLPGAPDIAGIDLEALWTYAPPSTQPEPAQPESLPTLAMPALQPSRAASPSTALLFSAGGLLALLAAGLVAFWVRAQKKPTEEPPSEPPDCPA